MFPISYLSVSAGDEKAPQVPADSGSTSVQRPTIFPEPLLGQREANSAVSRQQHDLMTDLVERHRPRYGRLWHRLQDWA